MANCARVDGELRQSVLPLGPAAAPPTVPLPLPGDADGGHPHRQQDHGELGRVRCQLASLRASHQVRQVGTLQIKFGWNYGFWDAREFLRRWNFWSDL